MDKPLVSIIVPNYNYARYLRPCLDSLFAQTYRNIEVILCDNASTDGSFEVACEYLRTEADRLVVMRQRRNFGPGLNDADAGGMAKGRYCVHFGSDDVMMPTFVERCMNVFLKERDVAHVVCHTDTMDEDGVITPQAPFYNQSCVIPGEEHAAVLMMAGVTSHSSQTMYDRALHNHALGFAPITSTIQGERSTNFQCSCHFDVAYIHEPLLACRMSKHNDGHRLDKNLLQIFGQFVLLHSFDELAAQLQLDRVRERLPRAIEKLGTLCLRYAGMMLAEGEDDAARRYLHMAPALKPGIHEEELHILLRRALELGPEGRSGLLRQAEALAPTGFTVRTVSYDPPPGVRPL